MSRVISILHKIEDALLVTLLLTMIGLVVFQIVLRNGFDAGIVWADPLVRVLVLWLGLIGAMVASRTDNHISIDIVSKYLPTGLQRFTSLLIYLFTTFICALMTWHSARFVLMENADMPSAFFFAARLDLRTCDSRCIRHHHHQICPVFHRKSDQTIHPPPPETFIT